MAFTIKVSEITDPFAQDFGLMHSEKVIQEDMSINDFFKMYYPDEEMEAYLNLADISYSTIIKEGDYLLVSGAVGKSSALRMVAMIAVIALSAYLTMGTSTLLGGALTGMGMTAAQSSAIMFSVITMIGSALVNALLAPDMPELNNEGLSNSKAYTWGDVYNTSAQMIAIPVVLGTFQVAGNLLESRTVSHNVHTAGISMQDTVYFLYGLTANKIAPIDNCKINNMDASAFAETDRSFYYTTGVGDQLPLSTTSTAIFSGETAAPAETGLLFPDLVSTVSYSDSISIPYHTFTKTTNTETTYTKQDQLDISASLKNTLVKDTTSGSITLKVFNFEDAFPTGYAMLVFYIEEYDGGSTGIELLVNNITQGSSVDNYIEFTADIVSRDSHNKDIPTDTPCNVFSVETNTKEDSTLGSYNANGVWDNVKQEKRDFISKIVDVTDLDDIKVQVVFPRGLYSLKVKKGKRYIAFVTFDFQITRNNSGSPLVATYLNDDNTYYTSLTDTQKKYGLYGKFTATQFKEFSILDIINDCGTTAISNFIQDDVLISDTYTISIRMCATGSQGKICAYDPTLESAPWLDQFECKLAKIQVIKKDTVLSYPYVSLAGLVFNATDTLNNQMPKATWEVSGIFYNYTGTGTKLSVSTWTESTCTNPAYLAINMMYNNLWGAGIGGDESDPSKDSNFAELVDIDEFITLADYCNENPTTGLTTTVEEDKRYTFNGIVDARISFWDALTLVLKSANAAPIYNGKKLTVYFEQPKTNIVQLFNSTNIKEGSFTESFLGDDFAECISGSYNSKEDNYTKTSVIYMTGDPQKTTNIDLIGTVDSNRAVKQLKRILAKTNNLRRVYDFEVIDSSAIACEVGDLIGITHDLFDLSENTPLYTGRISSIAGTSITLDKKLSSISSPHIIIRSDLSEMSSTSITNWDNSGDTTVIQVGTVPSNTGQENLYIIGSTVEYYVSAEVSSIDVNEDLTCKISAMQYSAELFTNFTGITINAVSYPYIEEDNVKVRNIRASRLPGAENIIITWATPKVTDVSDLYAPVRYLVYKKTNAQTIVCIADVTTLTYLDDDFSVGESIYYKVQPIYLINEREYTIPLSWCDFSSEVNTVLANAEYLPNPEVLAPEVSLNTSGPNLYDLTVKISDPNDWMFKDRREGYFIWLRLSDTDTTDDWFGPMNITLASDINATTSTTFEVSSTVGLPTIRGGTHDGEVGGLLTIGDNDTIAVWGSTGNTLNIFQAGLPERKFAPSQNHSIGESVYNANKGFFPIKYFSFEEYCSAVTIDNCINCSGIFSYDNATNQIISVSEFDQNFMLNTPKVYVSGHLGEIAAVKDYSTTSIKLDRPVIPSDFAIHTVGQDVTGKKFLIYDMYWESDSAWKKFKKNSDGNIEGTIAGISFVSGYAWLAVNRVLWEDNPIEVLGSRAWISSPSLYLGT